MYRFLGRPPPSPTVPGHFFTENAFIERYPRGIQKPTLELPTPRGTRVMAASSFSFQWQGRADQKNVISRDFWHFSNFDVFLKGEPWGIQKPKRDLTNSCGTRDMAARSFNIIGKHEGGPNINRDFLKFRFSDPLKAQNRPQRAPYLVI